LLDAQVSRFAENAHPGVIHQNIDTYEFLIDNFEQRSNLIWYSNVTNCTHDASVGWRTVLEIGRCPVQFAAIAPADGHAGACPEHRGGDGPADPLGTAGDHHYLPIEKTFHILVTRAAGPSKQDNGFVANDDRESRVSTLLRPLLPWTTVVVVLALLWTGWVFLARHQQAREEEREAERQQGKADRELLDRLGGDKLTLLAFYASPGTIHRGAHVSLCYGVNNAASVVIEPDLGPWKPALSRCIDIAPRRTTSYTLTAKNAKGETVTANATVTVE
jgi:hypothetical protein